MVALRSLSRAAHRYGCASQEMKSGLRKSCGCSESLSRPPRYGRVRRGSRAFSRAATHDGSRPRRRRVIAHRAPVALRVPSWVVSNADPFGGVLVPRPFRQAVCHVHDALAVEDVTRRPERFGQLANLSEIEHASHMRRPSSAMGVPQRAQLTLHGAARSARSRASE